MNSYEADIKPTINDKFSWKRVWALYRYNSPYIKRQTLIYSLAIIIMSILTILPLGDVGQFMMFTLIWAIIPYMAQMAPVIFAKGGDSRIIDRLVPASPMEKYIFYLSYILIVIPAVCYILPFFATWLYTRIPALQTESMLGLVEMRFRLPSSVIVMNTLALAATIMTCFFVVMYCRTNRVLKAILSVFIVQIAIGLTGAIYGFIYAFNKGFKDGMNNAAVSTEAARNPNEMVNLIMHDMSWSSPYMVAGIAILAIYFALMLRMSYRAVNIRNL